jgi:nucleoside-diphosphate-sugar epimerase
MRLLIAGGSGFIGKNLITSLPRNWTVFATYHRDMLFPDFVKRHNLANVQPIHCELSNKQDTQEKIGGLADIDACVYLAANTNVSSLVSEPTQDVLDNIVPLTHFLGAFRGTRLIFFSSGAVYMGLERAVSPDSKLSPTIPYSISKLASEHYIRFQATTKKTFNEYAIVRFFGAYGYHEPTRKITRRFLEQALSPSWPKISMTLFGDGENLIDVMWVKDAIQAIMGLINASKIDFTVDLCAGNACTINEYVAKLGKIVGKEVLVRHEGTSAEYIRFHASPERMRKLIGFQAKTSLQEGIARYIRWLKEQSSTKA